MKEFDLELFDYYINLFDYYENLFTDKQQDYFKKYYFEDLSLSEIAAIYNISRSAVFDCINKIQIQLKEFEEKLNLVKKDELRKQLISKYFSDDPKYLEFYEKLKEID